MTTINYLRENIEYACAHYKKAVKFYDKAYPLATNAEDQIFIEVANSSSIYITVFDCEEQKNKRIYRFSDHANCRRYNNAINVAPGADNLTDAYNDVKYFLGKK